MKNLKVEKRIRRHKRIRSKISGSADRPRVSVYKSNKELFIQVIDDIENRTLFSTSTKKMDGKTKVEKAKNAGIFLAKEFSSKKIEAGVFDRGGNLFEGRVKAIADGLREGGLKI